MKCVTTERQSAHRGREESLGKHSSDQERRDGEKKGERKNVVITFFQYALVQYQDCTTEITMRCLNEPIKKDTCAEDLFGVFAVQELTLIAAVFHHRFDSLHNHTCAEWAYLYKYSDFELSFTLKSH